ncbi:MAG: hypothetical protein VKJ06_07840 [Vampirovibrionales bacterium]|nr:hypothetical protein [Vampirovibrionales bacterium]
MSAKALLGALKKRLSQVLMVIDDALHSDALRDRIWAVEQILKRTAAAEAKQPAKARLRRLPAKRETAIKQMSDAEILDELRQLIRDPEALALFETESPPDDTQKHLPPDAE